MRRQNIMLSYPFEEKRLAKWEPPYFVQPKLDGERCLAIPNEDRKYSLYSSEGNEIISVPHILKALNNLPNRLKYVFDGELYTHESSFEEIHSRVSRSKNIHEDHSSINYYIFDLKADNLKQYQRFQLLEMASVYLEPPLVKVETNHAFYDEVMNYYFNFVNQNYEGIIVRH